MRITRLLARQAPRWLLTEAVILILLTGAADFYTGYEVSLTILYAGPIYAIAWSIGKKEGILMALLAGLVWWWANIELGHPYLQSWHEAWETFVRLSFFVFVAIGAASLRAENDAAAARIELLEQNQRLEQELIRVSEREQRRIGQDLHDGVCQNLAAIGCAVAALKNDLQRQHHPREASAAEEVEMLLKETVVQTRDSARGLVPLHLGAAGLAPALEGLAATVSRLQGVNCRFEADGAVFVADEEVKTNLYRVAQEAISNATKHGQARNIVVALRAEPGASILSIADDGVGFSTSRAVHGTGMGLSIMNYRARLCGGRFLVEPRPEGGTLVSLFWPNEQTLHAYAA